MSPSPEGVRQKRSGGACLSHQIGRLAFAEKEEGFTAQKACDGAEVLTSFGMTKPHLPELCEAATSHSYSLTPEGVSDRKLPKPNDEETCRDKVDGIAGVCKRRKEVAGSNNRRVGGIHR
jgi:hypothetical protein